MEPPANNSMPKITLLQELKLSHILVQLSGIMRPIYYIYIHPNCYNIWPLVSIATPFQHFQRKQQIITKAFDIDCFTIKKTNEFDINTVPFHILIDFHSDLLFSTSNIWLSLQNRALKYENISLC